MKVTIGEYTYRTILPALALLLVCQHAAAQSSGNPGDEPQISAVAQPHRSDGLRLIVRMTSEGSPAEERALPVDVWVDREARIAHRVRPAAWDTVGEEGSVFVLIVDDTVRQYERRRGEFERIQGATLAAVLDSLVQPGDYLGARIVGPDVTPSHPITRDHESVKQFLRDGVQGTGQQSPLLETVMEAGRDLATRMAPLPSHRELILITDGCAEDSVPDRVSWPDIERALESLELGGVSISVLALNTGDDRHCAVNPRGPAREHEIPAVAQITALRYLADETGGVFVETVFDRDAYAEKFGELARLVRSVFAYEIDCLEGDESQSEVQVTVVSWAGDEPRGRYTRGLPANRLFCTSVQRLCRDFGRCL